MKATHPDRTLHVYGMVEAASPALPRLQGRQGAFVRRIRYGPVAVLVSEVDSSMRLGRQDLLAHARVLEQVADRQSVLPMRFGVKARNEDELRNHLHDLPAWAALLRRFDGMFQVSIEAVHVEEEALRELIRRDPRLLELRDKEVGQGDLDAQARRVHLGECVFHALEALRQEDGVALLNGLAPLAREVVERTPPGGVLGASFLVERKRRNEFDAAVTRAGEGNPRLSLRYLGPQPPWAFLEEGPASREGTWDS